MENKKNNIGIKEIVTNGKKEYVITKNLVGNNNEFSVIQAQGVSNPKDISGTDES